MIKFSAENGFSQCSKKYGLSIKTIKSFIHKWIKPTKNSKKVTLKKQSEKGKTSLPTPLGPKKCSSKKGGVGRSRGKRAFVSANQRAGLSPPSQSETLKNWEETVITPCDTSELQVFEEKLNHHSKNSVNRKKKLKKIFKHKKLKGKLKPKKNSNCLSSSKEPIKSNKSDIVKVDEKYIGLLDSYIQGYMEPNTFHLNLAQFRIGNRFTLSSQNEWCILCQ